MRTLLQDLRFAARALRRRRLFTLVAVTTIALGIGAATAIYSVVDGVLLRPLPFREPARLVAIWQTFPAWKKEPILAQRWDRITLSVPEYHDLRDRTRSFIAVAAWDESRDRLLDGDRAELVPTVYASASMLDVLGVRPARGRMFLPGEDVPDAPPVALVSHEQWQTRYGGDPHVLGRLVRFEDRAYTIIGVLPPGLRIGRTTARDGAIPAYWLPLGQTSGGNWNERSNRSYRAIARLRPGVTRAVAAHEVAQLLDAPGGDRPKGSHLEEWQTDQTRDARAPLLVLLAAVALLLLIACANVATLLLGEATSREHEMAARLALGAQRRRLVRQLLTESVLLAALGGALGTALGWAGTRALVALAPPKLPGIASVSMDARVLGVALLVVVGTGLLFGLAPAIALVRAGVGVATTFRAASGQSGRGRGALQRVMVAAELALSVVLLVGAGLLARSFARITAVDPGFRTDHLLVVQTTLPLDVRRDSVAVHRVYDAGLARLAALPGVQTVTMTTQPPFNGGSSSSSFTLEGEATVNPATAAGSRLASHEAQQRTVAPGYFRALGVPLLAGRAFTDADRWGAPDVVVVSEALARRDFPGGSPIGRRVRFQGTWRTIVGVVADMRYLRLTQDVDPTIYTPFAQRDQWALAYMIRTVGDPAASGRAVRAALADAAPAFTISSLETMTTLMGRTYAEERYRAMIVSLFGVIAAVLAGIGMYGVTARAVARRTRETAIRLALGARPWRVARQLVAYTLSGAGVGVMVGLLAALLAGRALTPLLFGVTATDPGTYAGIVGLLVAIGVVASVGPARRAGRTPLATVLKDG